MQKSGVAHRKILRIDEHTTSSCNDLVVVEEPLEIRLLYKDSSIYKEVSITVTMRTPGDDFDLILGFLFAEQIIASTSDIRTIHPCKDSAVLARGLVLKVLLEDMVTPNLEHVSRNFSSNSSCGLCGKLSIEQLSTRLPKIDCRAISTTAAIIKQLSPILKQQQPLFNHTGGLHAAALFSTTGELITAKEDIGRHNAVDKCIGYGLRKNESTMAENILFVSSRIGFEIIQKAAVAGIPILAAVGAPSDMAVLIAEETGMTLIGFTKSTGFNIYNGAHRVRI